MAKDEKYSWVSFEPLVERLEGSMTVSSHREFAEKIGIAASTLSNIIRGTQGVQTDVIARMAAYFNCSVCKLFRFEGIDIKPRYEKPFFIRYEATSGKVTYEPLRLLFFTNYGQDKWKSKLSQFYDKVEPVIDLSEERKAQILAALGKEKKVVTGEEKQQRGLSSSIRTKIRRNERVNLKVIYNICKVLGCTPDYVMSYQ